LASYTVDPATGDIQSTNTWDNMPTPDVNVDSLSFSPSGTLLAVSGYGVQIFHFNGADPITPYTPALLPKNIIDGIAWDNNNHLYVNDFTDASIHVFTVTPTSFSEAPGSPYPIPHYGSNYIRPMIVVPTR
jgi:hypothetical protein